MKFNRSILFLLSIGMITIASCTKKDSSQPSTNNTNNNNNNNNNVPAPTVQLTLGTTSISTGDWVTVSIVATSTINIKHLHLLDILSGDTIGVIVKDSAFTTKQLAYAFNYTTGTPGSRTIKIIVTDANNQTSSSVQPLIVSGSAIPTFLFASFGQSNAPKDTKVELNIQCSSGELLKHLRITRIISGQPNTIICDSIIFTNSINQNYFTSPPIGYVGSINYQVDVTDLKNKISSQTAPIQFISQLAYKLVSMGAETNPSFGNFLSTPDFNVYNSSTGASHSSSIDIAIYYDVSGGTGMLIGSPYYVSTVYPITSWSVLNQTAFVFGYNPGGGYIDKNQSASDLANSYNNALSGGNAYAGAQISGNGYEYIYYKTPDGRYGEIHIFEVFSGSAGRVNFEILSQ